MNNLKDYIIVIDNIMPPSVADAVIAEYKDCNHWTSATTPGGEKPNVRNCEIVGISHEGIILINLETRKKIDEMVFNVASQAIKKYNQQFSNAIIEQDSGYDLLRYEVGSFYTTHTDSFKDRPRAVSCSFALNDDYEGGEFAFFNRELVYKLKKGSCIMFPSNFMYPHEIMPVTSGTRYSIITWFI